MAPQVGLELEAVSGGERAAREPAAEYPVLQVMKLKFGFVKVRYRGLKKNAQRLFVTCALVNLFVSRKKLLATA